MGRAQSAASIAQSPWSSLDNAVNALVQNREVLSFDKMDQLSQAFGRALFLAFPRWERLAQNVEDEKTGVHYFEVDIPQEGSDRQLHLSTEDNEITIAFDDWHTHVGPFLGTSIAESVENAMTIIEGFVTEQTVVKISRRDGVWIGSTNILLRPARRNKTRQLTYSLGAALMIRRL